jgi:hypothetical protein
LSFNGLHGHISHNIGLFISNVERASDATRKYSNGCCKLPSEHELQVTKRPPAGDPENINTEILTTQNITIINLFGLKAAT